MEYTALYRRFRPKTFDTILGQDHITQTLKNQVIAGRVGHAYLFTGCRGCGKTSAAKVLARAVNCLNPQNGEPCNECSVCKSALEGSLTDIVEMDAASNNSVDDVRAIRDEVNFLPTLAKYRVYIIDEVHMLSTGAFNALLKTLEEPPSHVKFILATTEPQKLPATILSRCQRFDFKKIAEPKIIENIENICKECNIEYTEGALNLIAELSEGAMRDALSILERCAQDGENKINEEKIKDLVGIPETTYIMNIVSKIINYDTEGALLETGKIINDGKDVNNIIWEMVKFTRDLMLLKTTSNVSNIYSKIDAEEMKKLIQNVDTNRLLNIIYKLSELENDIKWSSQKNIVFQVGVLKLCTQESSSLEERVTNLENNFKSGNFARISTSSAQNVENIGQNGARVAQRGGANGSGAMNVPSGAGANGQASSRTVNSAGRELAQGAATAQAGKGAEFWGGIIDNLKQARKPMLYSNLLNTKGVIIDDMTFGIEFPNGLNSFGKSIIEQPDNMQELKRLVSVACKKDMKIKLIDKKAEAQPKASNSIDLGIDINIID